MDKENTTNAEQAVPVHAKPRGTRRPSTIFKRTLRFIMAAVESVGCIPGCEEARAQLVEVAESIRQKTDLMKAAKKAEKDAAG